MYESFYGLQEKPFKVLPDPDYLYMSQGHENAFTHLEYGIIENKGFVVITGEVGSGKTTLINFLLNKIPQNIQVGLINNTYVSPEQLIKMVCQDFELDIRGMDKAEMMELFHRFLIEQFTENSRVVLIVDEAQNLSTEAMEEIRMLSNLEAEKHHLIQIVLVGQPELRDKLQQRSLRQFAQRVTVHCHLRGLERKEVEQFIQYRLKKGGGKNFKLFDRGAVDSIYTYSRGIPRLINILCDTALVYGYADGLKQIDKKVIDHVIRERESGGIFSEPLQEDAEIRQEPHSETILCGPVSSQFQRMARRIRRLENIISNMEKRLRQLENK